MTLSLVLPSYKDGPHLWTSIERIVQTLELLAVPFEVIIVDDASPDDSGLIADEVAESLGDGRIRVIHHPRNLGRGAAFLSGAAEAQGEIIGFLDVDLEVAPVYLLECLRMITHEDVDMVIGQRHYKVSPGLLYRHILSRSYAWIVSAVLQIPKELDSESGYKFFKREALESYLGTFLHAGWFWDTEVVSRFYWDGRRIGCVPCLFIRNPEKTSTVRPLRDICSYSLNLFSYWRLRRRFKGAAEPAETLPADLPQRLACTGAATAAPAGTPVSAHH